MLSMLKCLLPTPKTWRVEKIVHQYEVIQSALLWYMATAASQGGSEDSEGRGRRTMNPQSCVVAMVADANDDAT